MYLYNIIYSLENQVFYKKSLGNLKKDIDNNKLMWYTEFRKLNRKRGDILSFQYNKLRGRIKEICITNEEFSKRMGLSMATLSMKLNNKSQWTQPEIFKAVSVLGINADEIPIYFFTPEVQKTEL